MPDSGTPVTIDPIQMQQVAKSLDGQRTIIENCLNSIKQDSTSLKSLWEGESATAYQAIAAKIGEASPKVVSILSEYVLDLNDIASRYITDEQKVKAESEALPSDVFLD